MRLTSRFAVRTLVAVATLACATGATAQERGRPGFTFGARLGLAFPGGDILSEPTSGAGAPLDEQYEWALPLVLEAGYRFANDVTLGLYYQYAFASLGDLEGECDVAGQDCEDGRVKRFGAQLTAAFGGSPTFSPWIGGAIGWEWASIDLIDAVDGRLGLTYKGYDLTLQGGADFPVGPRFSVGPYASISLGRYTELQGEQGGMSASIDIDELGFDEEWHQWFQIGVRGRFDL